MSFPWPTMLYLKGDRLETDERAYVIADVRPMIKKVEMLTRTAMAAEKSMAI